MAEVCRFANDAGRIRSDDHRHSARRLYLPRDGYGQKIRWLLGRLPARGRLRIRAKQPMRAKKSDEGEEQGALSSRDGRRDAQARKDSAGSALHATAAALQGSDSGQGTRRKRHRASFDVCVHHFRHRRARICNKDQGRFTPTMLGERVSTLLVKSFEDIFDVGLHRAPGRRARRN